MGNEYRRIQFSLHHEETSVITLPRCLLSFVVIAALRGDAAEPERPDAVGLRPGMSISQAQEAFKRHNATLEIQTADLEIPALGEKLQPETLFVVRKAESNAPNAEPIETIQAKVSLPPNKPTVWKVVRSLRFEEGSERTKSSLLSALEKKYGKESVTVDHGSGTITRFWVIGSDRKVLQEAAAKDCATFVANNYLITDSTLAAKPSPGLMKMYSRGFLSKIQNANPLPEASQPCRSMTYIAAELTPAANRDLIAGMKVTIVDAALAAVSTEATRAKIEEVERAKAREEVEQAKTREVPKL